MYVFRIYQHQATLCQKFGFAVVRVQGRTFGDDEYLVMIMVVRPDAELVPLMKIDSAIGEIKIVAVIDMSDVFISQRLSLVRIHFRFRQGTHVFIVAHITLIVNSHRAY